MRLKHEGAQQDLRNGLLIAVVANLCLVLTLVIVDSTMSPGLAKSTWTVETNDADVGELVTVVGPPSQPVPVLCHHFLRQRLDPFQFIRIAGALLLNLPVIENMDVWTQTVSSFEKQVAWLKENGYEAIDLRDVCEYRQGRRDLPDKPVIITFDDGDRSVLEFAFPILQKYGYKATLFIITDKVGQRWNGLTTLTWDEIKRLDESGLIAIESHTHDMHKKVKTSEGRMPVFLAASRGLYTFPDGKSWEAVVYDDLATSRRLIETHLGRDARHLAWPYGSGNAAIDSIAVAAGFETISSLDEGINDIVMGIWPDDLSTLSASDAEKLELKRFTITARTSIRGFSKMMLPR
jgi:peptidoglycan/xylan/chitin deacetylase (PgdA/CDA1 family)